MRSMTGYGRAARAADGRKMTIELKSVNHRFLDLNFRMPRTLMFLEDAMRKRIGDAIARGHVDIFVTYENHRADAKVVTVDEAMLGAYQNALNLLASRGFKDDRTLMSVARLPDVFSIADADEDSESLKALAEETLGAALNELIAMRAREGTAMKADLTARADSIENITLDIEARYPATVEEYMNRLRASVEALIGSEMEESRLLTEVAVMADRSAISEEVVRLKCHIAQLRTDLELTEPIGRKVDFLVQELNREINTISSKSQDIPITRQVVLAKAEIEKLREQIQNIE